MTLSCIVSRFRTAYLVAALGAAGYYLNLYPIELAFGLSFICGGFFAFLAVKFLGFYSSILCAAIVGSATYILWGHPYAGIVFTLNVAFHAAVSGRRRWPLLVSDIFFWVGIGAPMLWVGYRYGLGMEGDAVKLVILKQALNNFLLSLLATSCFLIGALFRGSMQQRTDRNDESVSISLRGYLGILLVVCASIPTVGALTVVSNQKYVRIMLDVEKTLKTSVKNAELHLSYWGNNLVKSANLKVLSGKMVEVLAESKDLIPRGVIADDNTISVFGAENLDWHFVGQGSEDFIKNSQKIGSTYKGIKFPVGNFDNLDIWVSKGIIYNEIYEYFLSEDQFFVMKISDLPPEVTQIFASSAGAKTQSLVMGGREGQSLMQRWRQGVYYAPIFWPNTSDAIAFIGVPLEPFFIQINSGLMKYLTMAVLIVFAMPFVAWGATESLVQGIGRLPTYLASMLKSGPEPQGDRRSVFREINAITSQTQILGVQLKREANETLKYRLLLDRIMEVGSIVFFVFPYDDEAGLGRYPLYTSPSIHRVLGCTLDEISSRGWFRSNIHPDDFGALRAGRKARNDTIRDLGKWRTELRVRCTTGDWQYFSVEMFKSEFKSNIASHGSVSEVFCIMIDVTTRKIAEQRLLHHARLADLGVMATGIAHELNQPLDIIKLMATNMRDLVAENEADLDYLITKLDGIVGQVERAAKITNYMRLFGRSETRPMARFELRELLAGVCELVKGQLELRNVQLNLDLQDAPMRIFGHENLLEQVFLNILVNSMVQIENKSRDPSLAGAVEKIAIRTRLEEGGRSVVITFADNAGGINPSLLTRIFDPFMTTREPGKGTGLGLSVAFGIIKQMRGDITAENRDGGAVFTIRLPLESPVPEEAALAGV